MTGKTHRFQVLEGRKSQIIQHKGKGQIRKLSDDEDDDFEPLSKRHCGGSKAILREISQIKENLASVFQIVSQHEDQATAWCG